MVTYSRLSNRLSFIFFCFLMLHYPSYTRFSITPLLSEVQATLKISDKEIWSSSIAAVTGTIFMRFVLGPFCDKFGPRIPMGLVLIASAIPTGLTGLVQSASGLTVLRLFIGVGGSTFVMAQYWTSRMFTKEWVGTGKQNMTISLFFNFMCRDILFVLLTSFFCRLLCYHSYSQCHGWWMGKSWRRSDTTSHGFHYFSYPKKSV